MTISCILLGGGIGSRFASSIPKQFHLLAMKPIIHYSFELFLSVSQISEIVIVADEAYRSFFQGHQKFAKPGLRRQDSVFNALQLISKDATHVLVHDGARPLITKEMITSLLDAGLSHEAATLAAPLKFTVKEASFDGLVVRTLDRSSLFEIQTPQIVQRAILEAGFEKALREGIEVTDDVALAEILGFRPKLVLSTSPNLKITTREDLILAKSFLSHE